MLNSKKIASSVLLIELLCDQHSSLSERFDDRTFSLASGQDYEIYV